MKDQIAWAALFAFLTCMFLFSFGARSWWLVLFAAAMVILCCWGFGAFRREPPPPDAVDDRAKWAAVSSYFDRDGGAR